MSEVERPSGDVSRGDRSEVQRAKRDADARYEDLYRIAYEESRRTLDDQANELNSMRDRAVKFEVFIGAATAFLVGSGLSSSHRDAAFYALAAVASAASALMIFILFVVLNPSQKKLWSYRLSARRLVRGYIETEVPLPSKAQSMRALSEMYDDMRVDNERILQSLRRWYRWLIVVGAAQITIWAALVWAKG